MREKLESFNKHLFIKGKDDIVPAYQTILTNLKRIT